MARARVPDSTAWVDAIRHARREFFEVVARRGSWLSSVVLAELYAGARSAEEARALDRLAEAAVRADRLLVPTGDEWTRAGRLIGRSARLSGAMRPRDHLADVLIVVSAARIGGEILTANRRHFGRWVELAQRSLLDVTLAD